MTTQKGLGSKIKNLYLHAKALLKRIIFWMLISNRAIRFLRMPFITTLLPITAGVYLTAFEFFGKEKAIFTAHPVLHEYLIISAMAAVIFVAILNSVTDAYLGKKADDYIDSLHDFIRMNSNILGIKKSRFKKSAKSLSHTDDVFPAITDPDDQINGILLQASEFLIKNYALEQKENLRITILENHSDNGWEYTFDTHDEWTQTPAEDLLTSESLASECLRTGEFKFIEDKMLASANKSYVYSERDDRFGNGSAHCHPVTIKNPNFDFNGIVTIVTYNNKKLCSGYNGRESDRIKVILTEICRRIELELTLKSIKTWSKSA